MKHLKNYTLIVASIAFIGMIGAGVYETIAMVPRWSAAPPASLTMFQGQYGINAALYWMSIHPVTIILLISALISNWKTPRKKFILWPFCIYIGMLVITATYFVPELMAITKMPYQDHADAVVTAKAHTWEILNIVRAIILIGTAVVLLIALTKSEQHNSSNR